MRPHPVYRMTKKSLHIDGLLLTLLFALLLFGTVTLYSASNQSIHVLFKQALHLLLACMGMFILAAIPPHKYKHYSPWIYGIGLFLLFAVIVMGKIGKGAQRWLDLGFLRFQPSEIMKLAIPMMSAWYFEQKPLDLMRLIKGSVIILLPALLIAKQPDLGTAISVTLGGLCVIFLAGISMRLIAFLLLLTVSGLPLLWHVMHDYQKTRILTLLNPESDPLGAGYHIIQSKIAIGSGGFLGKGWLQGSQSHLNFLPEHSTDFIFAVSGEEFGFIGGILLMILVLLTTFRGLFIAIQAQTDYTRLLAASLTMSFFFSAFINMGMVMGILPVVGIPLPLVSYGGSALLTFLAAFGIIMSISTHRILFNQSI